MSTAIINIYVKTVSDSDPMIMVELDENDVIEGSKLQKWARKAMEYASQVVEEHPFIEALWQQDLGSTLTLTNETELEDEYDDVEIIEDDNTIGFTLDVSKNFKIIGGLNTPSVQIGNATLELLNMARNQVLED